MSCRLHLLPLSGAETCPFLVDLAKSLFSSGNCRHYKYLLPFLEFFCVALILYNGLVQLLP